MTALQDWATATTAAELMTRDVVTLREEDSLSAAATVLLHTQATGAPVVDEDGRCVGVLSVTDVVGAEERAQRELRDAAQTSLFSSELSLPLSIYESELVQLKDHLVPASDQPVKAFMTREIVNVPEEATLTEIIERMVDRQVHRVIVLDADERIQGIVSSMDVMAGILQASRS